MSFLAQDEVLVLVQLDLAARVLRVDDGVAFLDFHRDALAVVGDPAWSNRDNLSFLGLLLGRVGQDDAALGDFFLRQTPSRPRGRQGA